MSSSLPSCPCDHGATTPPLRRSARLQERAWRNYYNSCLATIASYDSLRDAGDTKTYEKTVLMRLIDLAKTPDKELRKITVRVVYEFLGKHTYIMENYPRFRQVVLDNIKQITKELYSEPITSNNHPIHRATTIVYNILNGKGYPTDNDIVDTL